MVSQTNVAATVVRYSIGIFLVFLTHFLYRGLSIRLRFYKLRARGLTVPEPYSFLFGHISLMKLLKHGLPSDAHDTYVVQKLSLEWQDYFPNATKAPPLAYLDLWPFLSQPLIVVFSPQACSQLTQETPQPRHSLFRWSLTPLTGGNDLTSVDMATHRVWRSRLNPGFSLKNLISQMDVLLEEVAVFAEKLRNNAGDNGTWGDVFTLYDDAVSLTFDIIFRSALCWVLYEIHKNPGILGQIHTEHDQVLGSDPGQATEVLSKQPHTLNDLRYTTAVIKESLRVHALGQTHREGSTGFNFSIEEIIYPTYDTIIQTVPAATQSHPDLWPRVKEFLPERFLVADGHPLYPPKNAWRTFELGSTRCIGEELAMMEIKLVLVFTLRELEFEFPSAGWDEPEKSEDFLDAVDGNRIYRVGNGLGYVKDNLPTRIRLK
ncbi:putative Cytochrome P450 [Seiridium cardinale]|uniref:Cytochrome P450 n=1 Tax=Seiridium cardinale TaxID=138064 RepID=A0ABR2XG83_9PEZI